MHAKKSAAAGVLNAVEYANAKPKAVNQISHAPGAGNGALYHITRKQKEQLEYFLVQGQLPPDMKDDKTITELFNTLTDENGSM